MYNIYGDCIGLVQSYIRLVKNTFIYWANYLVYWEYMKNLEQLRLQDNPTYFRS